MKKKIGFGGGCHWCTEAVFQSLKGVLFVDQGWISSSESEDSFSEGVLVTFDPTIVSSDVLIEIHLLTHSSSSNHKMREKYRSAVYVFSEAQHKQVKAILDKNQKKSDKKIVTSVLPMKDFKQNKESLLNYYTSRRDAPFCKTYIDPKIKALMQSHNEYLTSNTIATVGY